MNIPSKNKRRFYAYDFNKFNTNKIIFNFFELKNKL
jgi:hypothetical protein